MSEYTPTTEEIREEWVIGSVDLPESNAQFDRWLAAHDAEVREGALRRAEDAAAEALTTWWLTDTTPDEDTDSVLGVRRAIRALRGVAAEEPEWEYGVRLQQTFTPRPGENIATSGFNTPTMPHRTLAAARRMADLNPSYSPTYFQRRKAGPWVPVKQEGAET